MVNNQVSWSLGFHVFTQYPITQSVILPKRYPPVTLLRYKHAEDVLYCNYTGDLVLYCRQYSSGYSTCTLYKYSTTFCCPCYVSCASRVSCASGGHEQTQRLVPTARNTSAVRLSKRTPPMRQHDVFFPRRWLDVSICCPHVASRSLQVLVLDQYVHDVVLALMASPKVPEELVLGSRLRRSVDQSKQNHSLRTR